MTPVAQEITASMKNIGNKILFFGNTKCGTTIVKGVSVFSHRSSLTGKTTFLVVTKDAYRKFDGSSQKAAIYGKEGVDYFEYSTIAAAAKKIASLI